MTDYNPFAGTPSIDFDAINKKNEELKEPPKTVSAPVAEPEEPAAEYSPFGSSPFAQAPSASANPPINTVGGSQFGLANPPGGPGRSAPGGYGSPPGHGGARPGGSPGGYVGPTSSPSQYGRPPSTPAPGGYGQPASPPGLGGYGQPAAGPAPGGYGMPMGGGPVGLDGQPIQGASSYAPQAAANPYAAPPPQYGVPPPAYGAPTGYGEPSSPYGAPPSPYAPPGTWPPPSMSGPGQYFEQNTSGMGTSVPPEIERIKWVWGPLIFGWIWARAHQLSSIAWIIFGLGMASRIPVLGIAASIAQLCVLIWLCINGSKLAWQNRRFNGGVEEFKKVQRIWGFWALGFALVFGGAGAYFALSASSSGTGAYSSPGSSSYTPPYGSGSSAGDGADSETGAGGAPSAPAGDTGSAGAYGISGDSGSSAGASAGGGDEEPDAPIGFHPKN